MLGEGESIMRIAMLTRSLDVKRGLQNLIVWLCGGLQQRGHEVVVFTERYDSKQWADTLVQNLNVHLLAGSSVGRSLISSNQRRSKAIARQLASVLEGFDLAVATHYPSYIWALQARERAGAAWNVLWLCNEPKRKLYPAIIDRHLLRWKEFTPDGVSNDHFRRLAKRRFKRSWFKRLRDRRNRRWDIAAAQQCDMVVANSAFTAENARKCFGVECAICHLGLPVGAEVPYYNGDYIGVLTTLAPIKNVHNVLYAIRELVYRKKRKDVRLRVAGGGKREPFEQLAHDLKISNHVEFLGLIPDADLQGFFTQARIIVYCPIDEPFGLVPLEAMALRTPVIVSNHGGPAEVVTHGETGLHVNPFDPTDIAEAIDLLWSDKARAQSLAEAGYTRARGYFSLDSFVNRFEALMHRCVREAPVA